MTVMGKFFSFFSGVMLFVLVVLAAGMVVFSSWNNILLADNFLVSGLYFATLGLTWAMSYNIWSYLLITLLVIVLFGLSFYIKKRNNGNLVFSALLSGLGIFLVVLLALVSDYSLSDRYFLSQEGDGRLIRVTGLLENTNHPVKRLKQAYLVLAESSCHNRLIGWSEDSQYLLIGQQPKSYCLSSDVYTYDVKNENLIEGDSRNIPHNKSDVRVLGNSDLEQRIKEYLDPQVFIDNNEGIYIKEALFSPDNKKIAFTIGRGGAVMSPDDLFILELE